MSMSSITLRLRMMNANRNCHISMINVDNLTQAERHVCFIHLKRLVAVNCELFNCNMSGPTQTRASGNIVGGRQGLHSA